MILIDIFAVCLTRTFPYCQILLGKKNQLIYVGVHGYIAPMSTVGITSPYANCFIIYNFALYQQGVFLFHVVLRIYSN